MSARAGFSLVEALVALMVASMALLAVYELQQQLAMGQRRYEAALATAATQRNALALTQDLNPTATPSGVIPMTGGRTLRWTSAPLTPPRANLGYRAGAGQFTVRLYRVDVNVLGADRRRLAALSFERIGWRRIEAPAASPAR